MHWIFKLAGIWFLLSVINFPLTRVLFGYGEFISITDFAMGVVAYKLVRGR